MTRGSGLKRFCSELISSLRKTATSELASPGIWGPADQMHPDTPGGGVEAPPGALPGRVRGENDAVFAADRPVGGPSLSAIRRALLSDAFTLSGCGGSRTREIVAVFKT